MKISFRSIIIVGSVIYFLVATYHFSDVTKPYWDIHKGLIGGTVSLIIALVVGRFLFKKG